MPRYYFDMHDDVDLIDKVGSVLADAEAAKREAVKTLGEIGKELLRQGGDAREMQIVVRDKLGPLFTASLSFSITTARR